MKKLPGTRPGRLAVAFGCLVSTLVLARPPEKMDLPDWSKNPVEDRDLGHGVHDIIQTGDTFFHGFYPDIDQPHGGTIDGMIAFYDTLYEMCGPNTRIIPGHGPMATRDDVREYQGMLREVRNRVARAIASGLTEDQLIAAHPLNDLDIKWGGNLIKQPYLLAIVYEELQAKQKAAH